MSSKPIYFTHPEISRICMVCEKGNSDRHLLQEQKDGLYYGGESWHEECIDLVKTFREARNARNANDNHK